VAGGAMLRATFDLGNGSRVLISQPCASRLNLLGDARDARSERGGGLGGEASRQLVTLPELELAGRHFKDLEVAVDPQASASDLNVGVSVLRHFLITADFADHAVWLLPRD
jgi:Aspartyl protease